MIFSYAVRALYIESSAMFVRGGVYRVVKEAMGGTLAKLSVSALLFDYILTGPISGVSAGQLHRRPGQRPAAARRRRTLQLPDGRDGRVHRDPDHRLLLVAQHARHPREQRRCADDHEDRRP